MPPGMTLRSQLDSAMAELGREGDFESVIGAWLGDTIAIGVLDVEGLVEQNFDEDMPLLITVAISDSREAELFLDNLKPGNYVKEQLNEGILYHPDEPSQNDPTIYLTDGALLVRPSSLDAMTITQGVDSSLADNADFTTALANLPEEDYDALMYVDVAGFEFMAQEIQAEFDSENLPLDLDFQAMVEALGPQVVAMTIMGQSLVFDRSSNIADVGALENMGFNVNSGEPISLEFTNMLPANTAMFIQDTNFGMNLLDSLDEAYQLGEEFEDLKAQGNLDRDLEGLAYMDEFVTFMRLSFKGLSGLSMEEGFGWMTGNYILYFNIVPFNGTFKDELAFIPDFGSIIESTDSDAAAAFVNGIETLFYELGLDVTRDGDTLTLPILGNMFGDDALNLMLIQNGDFIISGTQPGVTAALIALPEFISV
jgi:hypothetical protein